MNKIYENKFKRIYFSNKYNSLNSFFNINLLNRPKKKKSCLFIGCNNEKEKKMINSYQGTKLILDNENKYNLDNFIKFNFIDINNYVDKIFIINLENRIDRKNEMINKLKQQNIKNFEFFKAINSKDKKYDNLYNNIIKKHSTSFVKSSFSRGALGCLLSHLAIIKEAKEKKYKKILIFEDDCLFHKNFNLLFSLNYEVIDREYDFWYLGKKQGKVNGYEKYLNLPNIKNIEKINERFYKPNINTWASHAWLIKNTIFDDLIKEYEKLFLPVDISVYNLYKKYNFVCSKNDLIITKLDDSDIQNNSETYRQWNWKKDLYI